MSLKRVIILNKIYQKNNQIEGITLMGLLKANKLYNEHKSL